MQPISSMNQQCQTVALICALIIFIFHLWKSIFMSKPKTAPEPKGAWPIIGHLHLFGGANQLLYRTLGSMADKYGPIFMIRLGIRRVLIVSNAELAKECFTTNDKVFSTRPSSVAVKLMGYNNAMFGFGPYGPYWREIRKITTTQLLSNTRLEILKNIRISEINMGMKELYQLWMDFNGGDDDDQKVALPVLVEMKNWFKDLTFNFVVRLIAGKRYSHDDEIDEMSRFKKGLDNFMYLVGIFVLSDAIPFLGFLDLQGHEKKMKRTAMETDSLLSRWVDEHRRKRRKTKRVSDDDDDDNEGDQDFMDVMISILNDQPIYGRDADTVIKSTCLSLILGGTDTTSVTLTWALTLLLNNRHVLKKAQDELDIHVGQERQVDESDIKNLVYLQAIVKETLRLFPAGPLTPPRMAMEDCSVAGFHVTKGTQLMVNLWKLHRDPSVWADPLEFRPERFLITSSRHGRDDPIEIRGNHFELLPFGSGRRICPGISFAMQVLHLTLANLLHGFHMSTPRDILVDMTESSGLTCPKATPLEVLLAPRLPSSIYTS